MTPCSDPPAMKFAPLMLGAVATVRAAGSRSLAPRVFYINDHGQSPGCDPDNEQALIHMLFHADLLDWEGIVGEGGTNCAPPGTNNTGEIFQVLDAYAADFPKLRAHASFPPPEVLRGLVMQGVHQSSPPSGIPIAPTAASEALVQAARRVDPAGRPLWVLTGGSLSDVSRALHDAPDILPRVRVYSIGAWNTAQDPHSRRHLREAYAPRGLWWIEANTTFRGVYLGGNQSGDYGDEAFVAQHVAKGGAMGALYEERKAVMKEGDMAAALYLMQGAPADPTAPSWGGRYRQVSPAARAFWGDLLDASATYPGASTISRWRTQILGLWRERIEWAQ